MNTKKIIEVTAAIIRKDNRFLCAQRKDSSDQGSQDQAENLGRINKGYILVGV